MQVVSRGRLVSHFPAEEFVVYQGGMDQGAGGLQDIYVDSSTKSILRES